MTCIHLDFDCDSAPRIRGYRTSWSLLTGIVDVLEVGRGRFVILPNATYKIS